METAETDSQNGFHEDGRSAPVVLRMPSKRCCDKPPLVTRVNPRRMQTYPVNVLGAMVRSVIARSVGVQHINQTHSLS